MDLRDWQKVAYNLNLEYRYFTRQIKELTILHSKTKSIVNILNSGIMMEHVYGIIDSKIQFMDFQIKEMIKTNLGKLPEEILISTNFLPPHLETLDKDDRILASLEAYSRNISLLLLMRTTLTYLSAETAFHLLTNDKYLDFTESQLRTILEEALYNQASKDLDSVIHQAMIKLNMAS